MGEGKVSFWERLFGSHHDSEREKRVVEYVVHRLRDGAHLRDVLEEEYVRRNASQNGIEQICDNPQLIEAAHEQMLDDFSSGVLDPKGSSRSSQSGS